MIKFTNEQKQEIKKKIDNIAENAQDEKSKAMFDDLKSHFDEMDDNAWFGLTTILGLYGNLDNSNK